MEYLTNHKRTNVTEQLRHACATIEALQEEPLDADQACVIYDLCLALDIQPAAVLDEALNLIDPGQPKAPPLLELLDDDPKFLDELGKAVML